MTVRYVHLTGPWPANHYAGFTAAGTAAATGDDLYCTESGLYSAENWSGFGAKALHIYAAPGIVPEVAFTAALSPSFAIGTNTVVDDIVFDQDNSHGYNFKVNGTTGVIFRRCKIKPVATATAGHEIFEVLANGSLTVTDLETVADPGARGFGLCYMTSGTFTASNVYSTTKTYFLDYYVAVAGGTTTITLSDIRQRTFQSSVYHSGSPTVTLSIDRAKNLAGQLLGVSSGTWGVTLKRCLSSNRIANIAGGTVTADIRNCYAPTLVTSSGAPVINWTGANNVYNVTAAGTTSAGDRSGVTWALALLDAQAHPSALSPLVDIGNLAGESVDMDGFPACSGRAMDAGPYEYQWCSPRSITGRASAATYLGSPRDVR